MASSRVFARVRPAKYPEGAVKCVATPRIRLVPRRESPSAAVTSPCSRQRCLRGREARGAHGGAATPACAPFSTSRPCCSSARWSSSSPLPVNLTLHLTRGRDNQRNAGPVHHHGPGQPRRGARSADPGPLAPLAGMGSLHQRPVCVDASRAAGPPRTHRTATPHVHRVRGAHQRRRHGVRQLGTTTETSPVVHHEAE
jgi:hypothetical protein